MSGPPRQPLRLVHPAPEATPERKRRGPARPYQVDLFSAEERFRLRAALKNARALFSTWACLADAMRVPVGAVKEAAGGRKPVTGAMAIRLARALGKPLESLYSAPANAALCPSCGRCGP